MSGDELHADQPALPVMRARHRLSPIWAIPLVAFIIAGWLAYTTVSERGPTITLNFRTGEGLEAGKTRVKHNDVELGVVDKIELSPDFSHVVVTASMNKAATPHLTAGTRFWVVRPRISLSSFSGLETLVSGAYLEMDPGVGAAAREFTGLEEPPVITADVPGREFILTTDRLGSIGPSSPIFYRSINVGEVLGYDFDPNGNAVRIHAFVRSPFDKLVFPGSRFWNDSGITFSAGAQGFKFEVESLQAVIAGGVGFDSPDEVRTGEPAKEGTAFHLFADHATVLESSFAQRIPFIIDFEGSVHGLEIGAPVEFRGIKVGNVTDIRLEFDPTDGSVRIPVTIDFEPQRIQRGDVQGNGPSELARVMAAMNELVARGLRAQLRTASLITGQLVVAFDFFPGAPPAKIRLEGKIPVMPSVPSDLESLTLTATDLLSRMAGLLERVNNMPIEQLLQQALSLVQSFRALAEAPELRSSVKSLDKTLADADQSLHQLDELLASASRGYGGDSQVRRELIELLKQLQDTAKSVKLLTDYVEQHPDAILRGKGAPR
ncbi:MAG TPA: MlaD family protein [Stellaceae bacterium]|nr:MlaD family protein [Stellaceae bacterium]